MLLAILQFIPLSMAAITPTMVILVIALLAHDGDAKRALAVVAGRYLGLLICGFASLFILRQIPESRVDNRFSQSEILPPLFLIIGIILMLAAVYTQVFGQVPSEQSQSSVLSRFNHMNAPVLFAAFLVTAFVSIRQLSLLIAGTAIIKESEQRWFQQLILLPLLCLMMIWPLLTPLVLKFGMGKRGNEMLERLRIWMSVHQRGINAVVLAFFGGMLTAKGIAGM